MDQDDHPAPEVELERWISDAGLEELWAIVQTPEMLGPAQRALLALALSEIDELRAR